MGLVISWTRIAEAECRVRAFTVSEEMPLAWALEAAHTMRVAAGHESAAETAIPRVTVALVQ